ncbi:MAG TPA: YbjN domain-containing protein [Myxococcota bacterium]|nr:YbjN domain-containing protein [Myxococcota bacterium]
MADSTTTRAFLLAEIEALEPFGFVLLGAAGNPLHVIEVTRREDGKLEVHVPGRPHVLPPLELTERSALHERGFASADAEDLTRPWTHEVADPAAAVELALRVLTEVFAEKPDVKLDIGHGSHRLEHEARKRLSEVRALVEKMLTQITGRAPDKDQDNDYLIPIGDVRVVVAPRIAPGGPPVVRVFAITNVGMQVTPDLGLMLARLNFGLMFGRFALDAEHQAIWFDETLLGDHIHEAELQFIIQAVATTADQWDDRLKQMFGGSTHKDVMKGEAADSVPPTKPGQGGYL